MFIAPEGKTCFVDVDDTLIHWQGDSLYDSLLADGGEVTWIGGYPVIINSTLVAKLIKAKKLGWCHCLVVWSHGGADWAARVVQTIGLHFVEAVDVVVTKPSRWYDDDKNPEHILAKDMYRKPVSNQTIDN